MFMDVRTWSLAGRGTFKYNSSRVFMEIFPQFVLITKSDCEWGIGKKQIVSLHSILFFVLVSLSNIPCFISN